MLRVALSRVYRARAKRREINLRVSANGRAKSSRFQSGVRHGGIDAVKSLRRGKFGERRAEDEIWCIVPVDDWQCFMRNRRRWTESGKSGTLRRS